MSKIIVWSVIVFSLLASRELKSSDIQKACESLLGSSGSLLKDENFYLQALTETHPLEILLETGSESFIQAHPFVIMNSAQKVLALINSVPFEEVPDSRSGFGLRKRYPFFTDAIDLTSHMFIVGQLAGIEALVSNIEAAAAGKSTGFHVPTLIGPPGTGKSVVLLLLREALKNGTLKHPEFYAYTYEWHGLNKFPELVASLPPEVTKNENPASFLDPINDSPFTLLPRRVQDAILSQHEARVVEAIGRTPRPKREPEGKSALIRDTILKRAQEMKGSALEDHEILEALSQHIRIRRLILGSNETSPILANQGQEPKVNRLFGSPNTIVKFQKGERDPFAVEYGVVAGANQGVIFWDEILKNELSLLGQLLNFFSSGRVEVAPANSIPVDVLNIAASNTEDIAKIKERDPDSPLLNRANQIPWNYLIQPDEIGRVLLLGMPDIRVRRLGTGLEGAELQPVSGRQLFELFPERPANQPIQTPHGRYAVVVDGDEDSGVFVAPHSLEFISYIVLLSRLNFDANKVEGGFRFPLVNNNDPIFSNPVKRLKVLLGHTEVTQAQLENLAEISEHSGEGSFGMAHRDVERWWEAAVSEARKSNNANTVTPVLLFETLKSMLRSNRIFRSQPEKKSQMILFANLVFQEVVAPGIQEDLHLAFARSEGRHVIDQVYDEVIAEISALAANSDATHYHSAYANERRPINRTRFKEIAQIYQNKTGRPLSVQEIGTWMMFNSRVQTESGQSVVQRNPSLMSAIAEWQTHIVLKKESLELNRLLDVASGHAQDFKPNEMARASELVSILRDELGYNLFSARRAFQFLSSLADHRESQRSQR